MALVSFRSCSKTLMASAVGRINFRRSASRRTSCITGNLPYAPLPMTSWRHFQVCFLQREVACAQTPRGIAWILFSIAFIDLSTVDHDIMLRANLRSLVLNYTFHDRE